MTRQCLLDFIYQALMFLLTLRLPSSRSSHLHVACATLAASHLYLDTPGLSSYCGTLKGHLQDAISVAGPNPLLIYVLGQRYATPK